MMELHLDTEVYNQFYSSKQRHISEATDNQFLTILIRHFDNCSKLNELSNVTYDKEKDNSGLSNNVPISSLTSIPSLSPIPTPKSQILIDSDGVNMDTSVTPCKNLQALIPSILVEPHTETLCMKASRPTVNSALDLRLNSEIPESTSISTTPQSSETAKRTTHRVCPECKYSTQSMKELNNHFEESHTDEGTFPCTCGDSFNRMPCFLRHYVNCPIAATDLPYLDTSGDRHSPMAHELHNSPLLNNETSSSGSDMGANPNSEDALKPEYKHEMSFLAHQSMADIPSSVKDSFVKGVASAINGSPGRPFKCDHCVKSFKSKALLDQHLHIHYPPRYTCRHCGKKYRWPPVFYHHQRTCKSRPQPGKPAATVGDLVSQHLLGSHASGQHILPPPQINMSFPNGKVESPSIPSRLTCLCGSNFEDFNDYVRHINSCQLILRQLSAATGQSALPISTNKSSPLPVTPSSTNHQLLTTIANSGGSSPANASIPITSPAMQILNPAMFGFNLTGSSPNLLKFNSSSSNVVQSTERNYCNICDKDFCSRTSLKQHIEGKHSAEAKYTCPGCGKRYRWGASFYYHKKSCPGADGIPENIPEQSF